MNKLRISIMLVAAFVLSGMLTSQAFAAQDDGNKQSSEMLAEMWVMVPKEGKMQELEKAIAAHIKFRQSKDDPRQWHVYSPVLGNNLDRIAVRAGGFTWKDMDDYRKWNNESGANKDWMENADQYIDHYHHHITVEDQENSHWGPDVEYNFVGVTTYSPKLGHSQAIKEDMKTLAEAAKANDWPYNWGFSKHIGGQGQMTLAVPYKNWAAMARPETTFGEILAKHLGGEDQAKQVMERWAGHFDEVNYNIWELRNDLMK